MTVALESPTISLDIDSSERHQPYGIITADCTGAKEYDDGLFVTPIDADKELYQVSVFAVDTSPIYKDGTTVKRVHQLTESRYDDPNSKKELYRPMLDRDLTQDLHFAQGTIRKAVIVSFMVGQDQPLAHPTIDYGWVEVLRNYRYNQFSDHCRPNATRKEYGRAAAFILDGLSNDPTDVNTIHRQLASSRNQAGWKNGSYINQTYMVAANHLVGRMMRDEGRLAIYRTHDRNTTRLTDVLAPTVARYSIRPAPHDGLSLDPYTRITSPLRRGEDFVMHGLLRARHQRRKMTSYDIWAVTEMERRLNLRVCAEQFYGIANRSNDDNVLRNLEHKT